MGGLFWAKGEMYRLILMEVGRCVCFLFVFIIITDSI